MHASDLHAVQSKMTASILNSLGYNQHYPHSVAFAPQHVFGVGLYDIRLEQGFAQIQALLDYVGTDHKVGKVILISLRHLQAEAGVSFDLFRTPTTPVCYLTDCWLVGIRNFCSLHGISINIRQNRVPQLARVSDSCLMDHALPMHLTKQQLIDLNLARIHLKVTPPLVILPRHVGLNFTHSFGKVNPFRTGTHVSNLPGNLLSPADKGACGESCFVPFSPRMPLLPPYASTNPLAHGQRNPI
jgi:hypothetical protein